MIYLLFHDVYVGDPQDSGFRSTAADRYKLTVSQFDRHLAGLAALGGRGSRFALTFDDGGVSFYSHIADRLESRGWRGYCFVPTDYIGQPGFLTRTQIQELDRRGHLIGSHSASHPYRIHACARGVLLDEWARSIGILSHLLGRPVAAASVPGGFYSLGVATAAAAAGVTQLFTSEPVLRTHRVGACEVIGRFTIRHSSRTNLSAQLAAGAAWPRLAMWAQWNAKTTIKPVLGPYYARVADWLLAGNAAKQ